MSPFWLVLLVLVQVVTADRDACDLDDPTLKKLCRKVESQEKYQEKWVATNFKAETVFRWYNANKDWLGHARLPRMMKRLLRRAVALNPGENDDFGDEGPVETSSPAPQQGSTAELEAKLEQLTLLVGQMALQLNQTQTQLRQLQQSRGDVEQRVNSSLSAHQDRLRMQANQSLQLVVSSSEQLAGRVTKMEKMVQSLKATNCSCSSKMAKSRPPSDNNEEEDPSATSKPLPEEILKVKWDLEREVEQLQLKLQLTAGDLEKSINNIQLNHEGALRNFSQAYMEGMKTLTSLVEDKLSTASSASYDVITNATVAFGEDLQVLRQAVSSSTSQIQLLIGQDRKSVRGLEEVRSGARRHETNIQILTTQLGEFKLSVQDQLNSIRTHFTQTVNEFYQKIVERQNAMSYRMGSIVDELSSVKSRVRNIPLAATPNTEHVAAADDDDPLLGIIAGTSL